MSKGGFPYLLQRSSMRLWCVDCSAVVEGIRYTQCSSSFVNVSAPARNICLIVSDICDAIPYCNIVNCSLVPGTLRRNLAG